MSSINTKSSQKKENKKGMYFFPLLAVSLSLIYTLFSLFIFPGYYTEREDQKFYMPPLFHVTEPTAYSRDFLMKNTQADASFFDEIVGLSFFGDPNNIYRGIFWVSVLSQFLFFLGITCIAYALSRHWIFALVAPTFFLIGHEGFICNALPSQSWIFSYGTELHARSLAISLLTFALGLFLLGRALLSWILVSIGILIHIVSALPIAFFMGIYTLFRDVIQDKKYFSLTYFFIPLFALTILLISMNGNSGNEMGFFTIVDPEWIAFMKERVPWIFFTNHFGSPNIVLIIYIPLFLFALASYWSTAFSPKQKYSIVLFCSSGIALMLMGFIGFDVFHIALFGQFQLYRIAIWLKIILLISFLFVCFNEYVKPRSTLYEKLLFGTSAIIALYGGTAFFLPLSIVLLIGVILLLKRKVFMEHKWLFLPVLMVTLLILFGIELWSTEFATQMANGKDFITHIISDPLLSLGYIFLWVEKILPAILILGMLLLITKYFSQTQNIQKAFTGFIPLVIILSVGALLSNKYPTFVHSPLSNMSTSDRWISENIKDDDLIFSTSAVAGEAFHIRDHLGKSLFVSQREGAQGTFNREYAMEWIKRINIQENPQAHWKELISDYKIDFVLASPKESFSQIPEVYRNESFVIYSVKK